MGRKTFWFSPISMMTQTTYCYRYSLHADKSYDSQKKTNGLLCTKLVFGLELECEMYNTQRGIFLPVVPKKQGSMPN